ncbi:MAG: hypothetical protein ABIK93_04430 [candidate division WOR-3 bacterium]
MNEMPEEQKSAITIPENQNIRASALIDILYLTNVTWLYVFSLIYPLFGIIFGVIISTGSISEKGKRIGKICLILGIINIGLSVLILIVLAIFRHLLTDLIGWTL